LKQKKIKLEESAYQPLGAATADLAHENQVWQQFLEGDDAAISWIYRHYIDKLYNYGCQFAVREVVLDAVQDLFFELIRNRRRLSKTRSVKAYLYSSLRRKLHQHKAKQVPAITMNRLEIENPFYIAVHPDHTTQFGVPEDDFHYLQNACNALPARQREIILLYYYEEMTYQEIMEVMQIDKLNTARILVYRALESLRKNLSGVRERLDLLLLFMVNLL
jgi:RNA polymerase sigma-70 factor (ECF subfamily)